MDCNTFKFLGLSIAGFSFSILLGKAMSLAVFVLWGGMMVACLVAISGTFAALQKNPNATGGQYLELLSLPVAIILFLIIGLLIGLAGG